MTVILHWWYLPIALVLSAGVVWYFGSKEHGMFGGMFHFFIGCGLMFGALCSVIIGLIK